MKKTIFLSQFITLFLFAGLGCAADVADSSDPEVVNSNKGIVGGSELEKLWVCEVRCQCQDFGVVTLDSQYYTCQEDEESAWEDRHDGCDLECRDAYNLPGRAQRNWTDCERDPARRDHICEQVRTNR